LAHPRHTDKLQELRNVDAQIERISQLIEQRDAKADEQSEQYEIANQEYSEVNQAIQDKQAELDPKNQECMDIQGQWSETRNSLGRVLVSGCRNGVQYLCLTITRVNNDV
jgi:chromosome segregation ATPase